MSKLYRSTVREDVEEFRFVRPRQSPPRRVKGKPVGEKYGPDDRQSQPVCRGLGHSEM
jgi:hypothetical protein